MTFEVEVGGRTFTVAVERTDVCTWRFSDHGALASFKSGTRRNLVHEGVFSLPFEMTLTAPNCQ